jgi:hypothetical protein
MAKIDKRSLPSILRPAIVYGNTVLLGVFGDFHSTSEGKAMMNMKRATLSRLARSTTA